MVVSGIETTNTLNQDHLRAHLRYLFWNTFSVWEYLWRWCMWIQVKKRNSCQPQKVKWKSCCTRWVKPTMPSLSGRHRVPALRHHYKAGCWERLNVCWACLGEWGGSAQEANLGQLRHHGKLVCVPFLYATVCHWTFLQLRSQPNWGIQN